MMNCLYLGAIFMVFLANPAGIDEVDCDAVQVAAKTFLEEAKREQLAVARGSANYGEFFSEMQRVREVSLPEETLQVIRHGLKCEAAKESSDWYFMATLFVEAARGEADEALTEFVEHFIRDARTRIKAEAVEREFISTVNTAYYYMFFVNPEDVKAIAKKAIMPNYWMPENILDEEFPNLEMLPYLQNGIVLALAALTPSEAVPILRDLQALTEKSSQPPFHVSITHTLKSMSEEMNWRINGEAPKGMSMYYLDYRGPGAPVIR